MLQNNNLNKGKLFIEELGAKTYDYKRYKIVENKGESGVEFAFLPFPLRGKFQCKYLLDLRSYRATLDMTPEQFVEKYIGKEMTVAEAKNSTNKVIQGKLATYYEHLQDIQTLEVDMLLDKRIAAFEGAITSSKDFTLFNRLLSKCYEATKDNATILFGTLDQEAAARYASNDLVIMYHNSNDVAAVGSFAESAVHEFIHKFDAQYQIKDNKTQNTVRTEMLEKFLQKFPQELHSDILQVLAIDFAILSEGAICNGYIRKVDGTQKSFVDHIMSEIPTRIYNGIRDKSILTASTALPSLDSVEFFLQILSSEKSKFETHFQDEALFLIQKIDNLSKELEKNKGYPAKGLLQRTFMKDAINKQSLLERTINYVIDGVKDSKSNQELIEALKKVYFDNNKPYVVQSSLLSAQKIIIGKMITLYEKASPDLESGLKEIGFMLDQLHVIHNKNNEYQNVIVGNVLKKFDKLAQLIASEGDIIDADCAQSLLMHIENFEKIYNTNTKLKELKIKTQEKLLTVVEYRVQKLGEELSVELQKCATADEQKLKIEVYERQVKSFLDCISSMNLDNAKMNEKIMQICKIVAMDEKYKIILLQRQIKEKQEEIARMNKNVKDIIQEEQKYQVVMMQIKGNIAKIECNIPLATTNKDLATLNTSMAEVQNAKKKLEIIQKINMLKMQRNPAKNAQIAQLQKQTEQLQKEVEKKQQELQQVQQVLGEVAVQGVQQQQQQLQQQIPQQQQTEQQEVQRVLNNLQPQQIGHIDPKEKSQQQSPGGRSGRN